MVVQASETVVWPSRKWKNMLVLPSKKIVPGSTNQHLDNDHQQNVLMFYHFVVAVAASILPIQYLYFLPAPVTIAVLMAVLSGWQKRHGRSNSLGLVLISGQPLKRTKGYKRSNMGSIQITQSAKNIMCSLSENSVRPKFHGLSNYHLQY